MSTESILKEIGLTGNETKVYLALLKLGVSASGLIIKKTGIHTSKVYDSLERLAEKGLVTHILEANVKKFKAVDPKRLIDFLEEKKDKISLQEKEIKDILPSLLSLQGSDEDDTQAEIFRGWKGMETAYKMLRDNLKKGETNYVFGASKGEDIEQVKNFFTKHIRLLAEKGIKQQIIYNESARGNIAENLKYPKLFQVKHLPNLTPAEINIWSDRVMVVLLTKKPTLILIHNKKVAESFKQYFELMWKIAKA